MLPAIWAVLRVYSPYIVFPFAVIVGTVGYNLESILGDRQIGAKTIGKSIDKERSERLLKRLDDTTDATQVESLKKKSFVPKTIFERNVSPSLQSKEF
ncbi:unnamed protein product [Medioppia subpectinata]|uniref:Small integral membrane protein 12 n=1 Tax=Medioppia subpectinata TaxID=1979941 RepID=A0A7R9KEW9_9ACAR|nr:unnamed protein product [Medioppia subpectinata]CAG2101922.1 unnamed protein product [Medioppia subpectinata]